jgi:hypothetical protein
VTGTTADYARPMPVLGFDPAPGDVGSTTALARRYAEIAAEISAVQSQVAGIDLARWEGKAAGAARARQASLVQALAQAADAVTKLGEATARWSPRLATYQAEADALERQAAAEQANYQYLATRAPRVPQLTSGLAESTTALAAIRAQAEQLHQEYLATAASIMTQFDLKAWWEGTEDIRKYPEAILALFDTMTADHWIAVLERLAEVPSEWVKEFGEAVAEASTDMADGASPAEMMDRLIKAAYLGQETGTKVDAWYAFAPRSLSKAADWLSGVRGASTALGVIGILGDVNDILSPQDRGTMGWVDRGAAATNAGFLTADLVGADLVMDAIPGVGEVTIAATGLYLAGDFLYHHWTPFHDVANDIGHATVTAADDIGHGATSAWHSITSSVGSWF